MVRHALEQEDRTVLAGLPARAAGCDRFDQIGLLPRTVAHDDATLGRFVEAGDAVEDRRLSGAVRPDERGDVAAPDIEGQVADGDQPAEAHRQMFDGQDRVAIPPRLARGRSGVHLCRIHQ